MGGCRCTYRNCTVRSNGTTHMFHYPVFDKIRCHQWLTNAQKHEFLNLKVSQLKNRVICQHHFKDEYFMNFKKEKLTFKAIPTLNGPFCDPGPHADYTYTQDETKLYPISLDDIETEYLTLLDKQANFSVKYGDFLTNSEVMDTSTLNISNNNNIKTSISMIDQQYKCEDIENSSNINLSDNINKNQNLTTINLLPNESAIVGGNNKLPIGNLNESGDVLLQPAIADVKCKELYAIPIETENNTLKSKGKILTQEVIHYERSLRSKDRPKSSQGQRVKILSEKKISEPVALTGTLTPVSPSLILRLPDKRKNKVNLENRSKINAKDENKTSNVESIKTIPHPQDVLPNIMVEDPVNQNVSNKKSMHANPAILKNTVNTNNTPSNKSLLKPIINHERVAAIEEKRKFNMKLRDIIESCLNKIDDQDGGQITNKQKNKCNNDQVGTFLAKETALPSVHEYTIACLEARMKRMEDVLSNKIDQNTQRIMELKSSISTSDKKSASTQTLCNEELQKKQLYIEISKYLSADASSLIYEELFINKYAQNSSQNIPSPKRRRRR